ncbi:APC family permease [Ktedonosporobacter rubrisoli]|uniref:APC family permease n=1 Tax=Ktedonosporobacter rubrisoli TaxID=2509675 RepID=A0A4P6JMC4_KTERU|nr:APC family permease [Ktedonosporobacter rubrisoli]QBD76162.1 APC family permease [Ktedonosporobacter rubrisoli]
MSTEQITPTAAPAQRLGRPILSTWEAIAQSLAIGPIFSVAFVATLVIGAAGISTPISFLLAAIGMLSVGWMITLYARRYAGAGAIYDYLRRISPVIGIVAACLYFTGILVLAGIGGYPAIGLLTSTLFHTAFGLSLPWWIYAIIAICGIFLLNHFGIRITTRVQLVLTGLSTLPLLFLALVIIVKGGDAGNSLEMFNPAHASVSGLFQGILFAITMFIGFEASASLGEETADPRRSIPRAIAGTVIIAAVFYLIITYASGIGFGLAHADQWAKDGSPLDTLGTRYVGPWLAVLIDIAVVIDVIVSVSAFTATTARGIFALARHGFLPQVMARTTNFRTRPDTPLGGNLFVFSCAVIVTIFLAIIGADPMTAFNIFASWGTILITTIYLVLVLCAVTILREEPKKWWRWIIFVIALIAPVLGLYGSVIPFPQWPNNIAPFGSLAVIVIAAIWAFVVRSNKPELLAEASKAHVWEDEPISVVAAEGGTIPEEDEEASAQPAQE